MPPNPAPGGPENLAEVLSRLFTSRGWGRKSERVALENAWAEVAGPEVRARPPESRRCGVACSKSKSARAF